MRYAGKGSTITPPPALQGCFSGSKRVTDLPKRVTNGSQAKSRQAEPPNVRDLPATPTAWGQVSTGGEGRVEVWGKGSGKAERVIMTAEIYSRLLLLSSCIKEEWRLNTSAQMGTR